MSRSRKDSRRTRRGARLSATEAARNFSELINRVAYNEEVFVIERGGRAVCEVHPVYGSKSFTAEDLVALLRSLPAPGDAFLDQVERVVAEQGPAESTRWRRSQTPAS